MSQPDFDPAQASEAMPVETEAAAAVEVEAPKRKQGFSVYTMMLIIAFLSLTVGSIIMFRTLREYGEFPGGFPWRTNEAKVNPRAN